MAGQPWGGWMDRRQASLVCSGLDNFLCFLKNTFKVERSWNGGTILFQPLEWKDPDTYSSWSGLHLCSVIIQNVHGHFWLSQFVREVYWYLGIETGILRVSQNAQDNLLQQRRIWLQGSVASRFNADLVRGLYIHLKSSTAKVYL